MRASMMIGNIHAGRNGGGRGAARGFSLIELMIVVAVVAILAAIAYPSYQEQVRKSRRAQAKADLMELMQHAERYHTVNNTYAGWALPFAQSPRNGTAWYNIPPPVTTQATVTLTAVPSGAQAEDKCGTLGINQAGAKTASRDGCW